jgi:hypothetical protein
MAHYARLNVENFVEQVIVINNDDEMENGVVNEVTGIMFCIALTGHPFWRKTSYNNNIRKQYAGIGYTYDPIKDIFVAPQPYPSWVLDSNSDWQAPTPRPQDGNLYYWDESTLSWNLVPLPESSSDNGA